MRVTLKNSIKNYSNLLIIILFLLSFHTAFAQIIISGKVIDEHGEPLPFVHLRVENTNLGTISNENGLFKLVLGKEIEKNDIVISSVGYKTKKIFLKEGNHTISLTSDITKLEEITIVSKDYAKELIQKAITAIPNNYPREDELHTGFFREITSWNKEENPIYLAEAVIESQKKAYTKAHRSGYVKLVEFRKYESGQLDSLKTRIRAGSHHIHRFDVVSRREAFLRNPNDGYKYKIKDTLRQDGNNIYQIYFEKKDKISGYIYVIDSSFAIIKADIKRHSFFELPEHNRQFLNYTITYEKGEDNVWRFKHSRYETAFKKRGKLLNLVSEYVTTGVEPNKVEIPYSDRLQFDDILLDESRRYEPNFWNNYNIILPNEESENLFKSIDYSKTNDAKKTSNKFLRILRKLRQEVSFTWTSIDVASNTVAFGNSALEIQQSLPATKENVYGLTYSFLYELKPNFFLGYTSESNISKNGIISHDLSISRSINLNSNGRPFFVTPGINLGYQELKYLIGNFNATRDFNINGKSFDSGATDVFLSQRNFRFQPNLAFSIEKNNRLSFMFSFGYNIPLKERTGLLFYEKEGFFLFRKKAFIENGDENLSIERSNSSLKNNINISAGISLHL